MTHAESHDTELPVPLTPFVGRAHELAELEPLLGAARLLTLTGGGGSGKTRLALALAEAARATFARVAWADLAPIDDARALDHQLAAALRVPEQPGAPMLSLVAGAVGGDRVLLVLDNCEHVVDAAAAAAEQLLRACPRLVLVATSREALGVSGETAWLVPPLACDEAVQLFGDRARAALPSFALGEATRPAVQEICRRLDGLPLAIELAAARVRVLSPAQIAARLDDAFRLLTASCRTAIPRHRTLRATMDWSHALLGEREQVLLRRLAVFAGSFGLEAAEAVCAGGPLAVEDVLDGVAALVDKSLVTMEPAEGEARYRLLEAVRQYGAEKLAAADEERQLRDAHAAHYLAFAERVEPELFAGAATPAGLARVSVEADNLRAAAEWAERDLSRAEIALRLGYALHWFWWSRGQLTEARQRLEAALAAAGPDADPLRRGRALLALGFTAAAQMDVPAAAASLQEAAALLVGRDEPHVVAYLFACMCAGCQFAGDDATALAMGERAMETLDSVPPHVVHGFVRYYHGRACVANGQVERARRAFEEAEELGRALGHRPAIAHTLSMLGRLALADGELDAAFARFAESLEIHAETHDPWGSAIALDGLTGVALARGQHRRAVRVMAAAAAIRTRIASAPVPSELEELRQREAALRDALGDDFERLHAEGAATPLPELVRAALQETAWHTQEHAVVAVRRSGAVARPSSRRKLRVLALGALQVSVGDRVVEPGAWGSARPRELLAYLLMHPDGRTKEQVGLAFWPDASASQLRNSFHVTLHRLRRALGGAEYVTLAGDRYRVDPELVERFDVAEFEREVVEARRALVRQREGAAAWLEQALSSFRGDFLDGEPAGDWHVEHRDRLQRTYLDALVALGAHHAESSRHDRAAEAYRRVLARDELHEDAVQALMRCLAESGERAQALRAYQRFAARLREELGAAPSAATTRIAERVQSGVGV